MAKRKLKLVADRASPARRAGKAFDAAEQIVATSRERLIDSQEFLDDTSQQATRPAPPTNERRRTERHVAKRISPDHGKTESPNG
jgi:hypothetical protein